MIHTYMRPIRTILTTLLLLVFANAGAQENYLTVDTVYYDAQDLEAAANVKLDKIGNPCALVKIELPLQQVIIDKDANVMDVDYRTGEIWTYITANEDYGATELRIQHGSYYPLVVKFSDWGIEPKAKCVYHIVVSIPTALFAEATRLYNSLRFVEADSLYRLALTSENTTSVEKELCQKRISLIRDTKYLRDQGSKYAAEYAKLMAKIKAGETVPKSTVLAVADSAIFYYNSLFSFTAIDRAQRMRRMFTKVKSEIAGTMVVQCEIELFQIYGKGLRTKKKAQKLKDVSVTIKKGDDETIVKKIDTDDKSRFSLELSDALGSEISVEYDGFKTKEPIKLVGRDNLLKFRLTKE